MLFDMRGKQDGKIFLRPVTVFHGHTRSISSAFLSPLTGEKLATVCYDDKIRVYEVNSQSQEIRPSVGLYHNNQTGRWLATFKVTLYA